MQEQRPQSKSDALRQSEQELSQHQPQQARQQVKRSQRDQQQLHLSQSKLQQQSLVQGPPIAPGSMFIAGTAGNGQQPDQAAQQHAQSVASPQLGAQEQQVES